MTSTPMRGRARAMRPNMQAVAARAGVAVSSVSRVLSSHPDVSPVMRNRVLDAVSALGYQRDLLARSLRTGATYSVGFVTIDIANPVIAQNAAGAEERFRDHGYALLISSSSGDPALDIHYLRHFEQRRVDGMMLSLADENSLPTLDLLRGLTTPLVLIDRSLPKDIPAGSVLHDHSTGVEAAIAHLASLGHRNFALVNGAPHVRPSKERAKALRKATQSMPDATVAVRAREYSEEHGYQATLELLASSPRPTALFVGGNQILGGVLRALRVSGMGIPSDVSLVTFDRVALCDFLTPPLALISRDPRAVGSLAADLLLEEINGLEPRSVTVATTYEPAASVGPAR